jgi:hypothetical protein
MPNVKLLSPGQRACHSLPGHGRSELGFRAGFKGASSENATVLVKDGQERTSDKAGSQREMS